MFADKIISIDEECDGEYVGYIIKTNNQTIKVLIENFQNCCEEFGYKIFDESKNNIEINSLIDEYITDVQWNHKLEDDYSITIEITTKINKFYIQIYNIHHGYYLHDYIISWNNNTGKI